MNFIQEMVQYKLINGCYLRSWKASALASSMETSEAVLARILLPLRVCVRDWMIFLKYLA